MPPKAKPPVPVVVTWLVQGPDHRMFWSDIRPEYHHGAVKVLAYGWDDSLMTWTEPR